MASYHFKIKTDQKPDGTKVKATDHVDYNNRDGKYNDIDQKREQSRLGFEGNSLQKINQDGNVYDINNKKDTFTYENQYGNIQGNKSKISVSSDASNEVIQIALALAMKQFGDEIHVDGTNKYKAQVIVAAVEMELPIRFSDSLMQDKKNKLQEEQGNARGEFVRQRDRRSNEGEKYNKPDIKCIGQDAPPERRNHLRTLSELGVVLFPERSEVLLSSDVSGDVVNHGEKSNYSMRRDISRARREIAEKVADQIIKEKQTSASRHADYINRESSFEYKGGCVHQEHHLPKWASDSSKEFWKNADKYEETSTVYREIEFALPIELNLEQQKELVNEFVQNHLGDDFYWSLAIHEKEAAMGNGERNPHCHLMFSERKLDEIEKNNERSPEIFFKKANRVNRQNGGCAKDPKWNGEERFRYLVEMRKDFAMIQNHHLEKHGYDIRVDHRTLVAQREAALQRGDVLLADLLNRIPEQNVGPKHVYQAGDEKVTALQQYRQVKKEHQQLIIAADILQKSIFEEERNQSTQEVIEQANIALSDVEKNKLQNVKEIQTLSSSITEISKELAVVRDLVISNNDAYAMARRTLMSPEELKLESVSKLISEEKLTLKRLEKEMPKPTSTAWYQTSLADYTKAKEQIKNRILDIDQETKEISIQLQQVNLRFNTKDNKEKIRKAQNQIIKENQHAKELEIELQQKLDATVLEIKTVIGVHVDNKIQSIEKQIQTLLAKPLQEQAIFEEERIAFNLYKNNFNTRQEPSFYSIDRGAWIEEKIKLEQMERTFNEREKTIQDKIDAIRKDIYEGKPIQESSTEPVKTIEKKPIEAKSTIEYIQFTAKEAYAIIDAQIRSLTPALNQIKAELDTIRKGKLSPERMALMAKHRYLGNEYKLALAEKDNIKAKIRGIDGAKKEYQETIKQLNAIPKPRWFVKNAEYDTLEAKIKTLEQDIQNRENAIATRVSTNQKQLAELEAKCITPSGKIQIEKIIKGIEIKNNPMNPRENELAKKQTSIEKEISALTKQRNILENQVKHEKTITARTKTKEPQYKVSIPSSGGGGGGSSNGNNSLLDAAQRLANAFSNPKIASLIARSAEEEIDIAGMTAEQIETYMAKVSNERD